MSYRIFISSVQREFAKERKALASYIRKDAILGKFFEVFLFEEVPAQERKADGVYLSEVDECDIYLGIFGHAYGNADSSGGLPRGMTIGKLFAAHKSVPVNPLLARAMYLKGYIEKSGTGTGDMIEKCAKWGVPAPEWYEDDPDDFRVVLKRPVSGTDVEKSEQKSRVESSVETGVKTRVKTGVKTRVKKRSSADKILTYLTSNPSASAPELAIVANLTVKGVEWNLKKLTESNRLRRVGPDKGGRWEVIG